ncbi:PE family protein [Mycobacterium riyadhense]|uniref:PE domain-containing protein n=1 Tax=Mycobacterium riyadhense TaxID=486698 RepID=A0A1X2BGX3_9MYCO|nr:PE family protein [Mycobacterium riyadhense]MCV7145638.1 PE family protein [Mycobacterium riyadhense]ORW62834.1 hypothetical protein AWC22_04070 [Mycobacterium riyadhense]VTP01097.1 PE family protein [Mycobacterium riyadhense]
MSFLFAEPQILATAATDLVSIGSTVDAASTAAASATISMMPAGLDEVSAAIAALFGSHGQAYQEVSARLAVFHDEFVRALNATAAAYAGSEAANVQSILASGEQAFFGLSGSFSGGLSVLPAPFGAALTQLAQTGGTLAGSLSGGLPEFGAALQTSFRGGIPGLSVLFQSLVPGPIQAVLTGSSSGILQQIEQAEIGFNANLVDAELAFNQSLVANEMAWQRAVFGTDNALNGAINNGFGIANSLIGTGEQFANVVLGAQVPANFNASLSVGGSAEGGTQLGGFAGAIAHTFMLNANLLELAGGAASPVLVALGVNAPVQAMLGAPAGFMEQVAQGLVSFNANLVSNELAFNQALVANEMALQQGVFGTNTALNGVLNRGFNLGNLVIGTGQQFVNVVLGAPTPEEFTVSLIAGEEGQVFSSGEIGGVLGAVQQKLMLDAQLVGLAMGGGSTDVPGGPPEVPEGPGEGPGGGEGGGETTT